MPRKLLTVEDNTAPPITLTLERDGVAINVTGCTVDLYIKNPSGSITNTGHTSCTLTTPGSGIVTYTTQSTDFPVGATYNCEVKITYGDATVETLYETFNVVARTKLNSQPSHRCWRFSKVNWSNTTVVSFFL